MNVPQDNGTKRKRWLSNFPALRGLGDSLHDLQIDIVSTQRTGVLRGIRLFLRSLRYQVTILNNPPGGLIWTVCVLRWLLPIPRNKLVLVDVVFSRPDPGIRPRLKAFARSVLWRQVDLFVNYMQYVAELEIYYGISRDKCIYVPFKVNSIELADRYRRWGRHGAYVFTGGQSRRDFGTFLRAMDGLPYAGLILAPNAPQLLVHGTSFDESSVPPNVTVTHDDGSLDSWIDHIARAKVVVFCISTESISPSGVSAYLLAMALEKCVIVSECPATCGILEDGKQAIVVPQRDAEALRSAIERAMEDTDYRERIARAGYRYAMQLGGERQLMERICACTAEYFDRCAA